MNTTIKSNISRLYIIKIAKWFMLYMPIVVPFYMENDLGMKEVMLLQGIYSVAIVIMEIPSGYFADVLGRRKTLLIGTILGFAGFLSYSLSHGFWGFLLAEIILGLGQSLISGADSAMLYDSLLDVKRENEYLKYEGRITSTGNIAEAAAGILGGLLAGISLRMPYIGQTLIALIAIPAAFMLVEPGRHKTLKVLRFSDILSIVRYALIENKSLKRNIFFSAVTGTATLTMAWFVQPLFQRIALPIEFFGVMWTLLNLIVGVTAAFAHRIESRVGQKISIILIASLIPAGYLLAAPFKGYMVMPVLILFYIVRGYATPVLKDYINRLAESEIRATILSVRNFIIRFNFALVAPLLGWITDTYSLKHALSLAGILFMILSLVSMFLFLGVLKSPVKR